MKQFLIFWGTVFMFILLISINSIMIMLLWNWLVSPIFDLIKLNLFQSLGLSVFIGYIKSTVQPKQPELEEEEVYAMIFLYLIRLVLTIIMGLTLSYFI